MTMNEAFYGRLPSTSSLRQAPFDNPDTSGQGDIRLQLHFSH